MVTENKAPVSASVSFSASVSSDFMALYKCCYYYYYKLTDLQRH